MNINQLSTQEEATRVEAFLNKYGIKGGVEGIYVPSYNGPFRAPEMGEKKFFHTLMKNGESANCGLVMRDLERYPEFWVVMTYRG